MKDTTAGALTMLCLMLSGALAVGLVFWVVAVWRVCVQSAPWWYCLWIVGRP